MINHRSRQSRLGKIVCLIFFIQVVFFIPVAEAHSQYHNVGAMEPMNRDPAMTSDPECNLMSEEVYRYHEQKKLKAAKRNSYSRAKSSAPCPEPCETESNYFWNKSFWEDCSNWRWVIAIAGGAARSSDLGASQSFTIKNPNSEEFYQYSPSHETQTEWMGSLLFGGELVVNASWLVQPGVEFYQTGKFPVMGTFLQGSSVQSQDQFTYKYDIQASQVMADAKLLYRPYWIHPYIQGGIGASFNQATNYSTNVPPFLTFTRKYENTSTWSFAYVVGAGFDADLTESIRLGLGYRFTNAGTVKLEDEIDTTEVSGTLKQSHFNINELMLQLTFLI